MSAATYQPPTLTLRLDQSHWASQFGGVIRGCEPHGASANDDE
jgi:hypothetical protein